MERLWAPWRREFVEKHAPVAGCVFCELPKAAGEEAERRNLILGGNAHAFAILNRYPYTSGHLMVIPRRHTATFETLAMEELSDLTILLQQAVAHVRAEYRPDGVNLGMNLGHSAGAGIAEHLHWHVVPRWTGDTNFMPVIGDVRVMHETLERTWERLRPHFAGTK